MTITQIQHAVEWYTERITELEEIVAELQHRIDVFKQARTMFEQKTPGDD
jgi:hypothetical protein